MCFLEILEISKVIP